MNKVALLERLHALLQASAARFGQTVDRLDQDYDLASIDVYPCGKSGVIAFIGEYVLTGWEDADRHAAAWDAYQRLGERLASHGFTRHMVYPLNFPSVRLTRKLGAVPLGVDADGYMHYILTLDAFQRNQHLHLHPATEAIRHGQEVSTAEST